MMMRKIVMGVAALLMIITAARAENAESPSPSKPSMGKDEPRNGFISYDIREDAEKGVRTASPFYRKLDMQSPPSQGNVTYYITQTEMPYGWLDRDLFIHVSGASSFNLFINDRKVGFGSDNKAPTEFNISKFVTDGMNTIRIESISPSELSGIDAGVDKSANKAPLGEVYLYSQPKVRVLDYTVVAGLDSLGKSGVLQIEMAVSNSYNSPETITVGYDIYSPIGKLQYYDMKDAKMNGHGTDTVRFREPINGVAENLWSAESPRLYRVMLYVKRAGRLIEYIPLKIGFGKTEQLQGQIVRNGKPIKINAATYNAASTADQTRSDLLQLKSQSVNTICVDYPQKDWFYDLCDLVGLYVIDQANINNPKGRDDLKIGGTTSNDPRWLNSYLERVESVYARNRNHTSVVAWSLGGASGNGYNMYRAYQWLKRADPVRAIIYRDADGEWNSDVEYPEVQSAKAILERAAATKTATKTATKSQTRRR